MAALAWSTLACCLVDVLLGLETLERQRLEADKVLLGSDQLSGVLRLLGLGLVERSLIQARINLGQDVTLVDVLAFLEQHFLQLAVDLGMNGDREGSLRGPEPGQVDRQVLAGSDGDADRNRDLRDGSCRVRGTRPLPQPIGCPATCKHCQKHEDPNRPSKTLGFLGFLASNRVHGFPTGSHGF